MSEGYQMSEETARILFGAVTAYIDAEAEVRFLGEIDEPATAEVGKRFAARAENLKTELTKEAKRKAGARMESLGLGGGW